MQTQSYKHNDLFEEKIYTRSHLSSSGLIYCILLDYTTVFSPEIPQDMKSFAEMDDVSQWPATI
jgi:hypothetical protein